MGVAPFWAVGAARMIRTVLAFLLAVAAAFLAASIAHTQFVIAGLQGIGADISLTVRAQMTITDIVGFASTPPPNYLLVIAFGFLVAFPIAMIVRAALAASRWIAYPIAGAAAVGLILWAMHAVYETTPIAGARTGFGFAMQMLAGALGGLVFASCARRRR